MGQYLHLYDTRNEFLEKETVSPSGIVLSYGYFDIFTEPIIVDGEISGVKEHQEYREEYYQAQEETIDGVDYYTTDANINGQMLNLKINKDTLICRDVVNFDGNQGYHLVNHSGWTYYPNETKIVALSYQDKPFTAFRAVDENGQEYWINKNIGPNVSPLPAIFSAGTGTLSGYTEVTTVWHGIMIFDKVTKYQEKEVTTSVYPGVSCILESDNTVAYNPAGKIIINNGSSNQTVVSFPTLTFESVFEEAYEQANNRGDSTISLKITTRGIQIFEKGYSVGSGYDSFKQSVDFDEILNVIKNNFGDDDIILNIYTYTPVHTS